MHNLENYGYMANTHPSAAGAASSLNYAVVPPVNNGVEIANGVPVMMDKPHFVPVATKRQDIVKAKPAILSIKRFTFP